MHDPFPFPPSRLAGSEPEAALLLDGWGISTIEMFYRIPDYQRVLNSLVLQMVDLAPDFPKLFAFIDFWKQNIDGPLHSVRFTHHQLAGARQWRHVVKEIHLQ